MKLNYKLLIYLILFICISIPDYCAASVDINPLPELKSNVANGYSCSNFSLENTSDNRTSVKIQVLHHEGRGDISLYTEKTVLLEPKETKVESIYCVNNYAYRSRVFVIKFFENGKEIFHYDLAKARISRTGYYPQNSILIDKAITKEDSEKLFADGYGVFYVDNEMKEMPTDWLTYTQYNGLMFYDNTFNSFSEDAKKAILNYVRVGGKLNILGDFEIPNEIRGLWSGKESKTTGMEYSCQVGLGYIRTFSKDLFKRLVPLEKKNNSFGYNSNKVETSNNQATPKKTPLNPIKASDLYWNDRYYDASDLFSYRFNDCTSLMSAYELKDGKNRIDKRSLVLSIVVIVILIGPINLIVLKSLGKMRLVFFTTPVLCFICGILLLVYYYSGTYTVFDIYRQSLTLLNDEDETAITYGAEIFSSGRSIDESIVFPLNSWVSQYYSGGHNEFRPKSDSERVIKFDDNTQSLTKNWIKAGKPLALTVVSIRPNKAYIEANKADDGKSVIVKNSLGTNIKKILLISSDGKLIYELDNIQDGATASSFKRYDFKCQYKYYHDLLEFYRFIEPEKLAKDILRPGEFLAFLESDPYLAQSFDSKAKVNELGCAVLGRFRGSVK